MTDKHDKKEDASPRAPQSGDRGASDKCARGDASPSILGAYYERWLDVHARLANRKLAQLKRGPSEDRARGTTAKPAARPSNECVCESRCIGSVIGTSEYAVAAPTARSTERMPWVVHASDTNRTSTESPPHACNMVELTSTARLVRIRLES